MRFKDIKGHEEAKHRVREMVASGRLPHAILLSGPEGIGKLAFARAIAAYVQCKHPTPDGDSCGQCDACLLNSSHSHPDLGFSFPTTGSKGSSPLISVDYISQWREFIDTYPEAPYKQWLTYLGNENAQPTIKVEETKEIIRVMNRSNYSAGTKVLIMWLPEKLQLAAANRLLKLIEEPAEGKLFILVSSRPNDILPTIQSRLQRIELNPLSEGETAQWLMDHYHSSLKDAETAARIAGGNLIKAVEMIDSAGERKEFFDLFCELMRLAYSRNVAALKTWSETLASGGREKERRFLLYLARQIRENFVYNLGCGSLNALTPEEEAFSSRFARFIHTGNIEMIEKEIDDANRDILQNGNAKIIFFDFAVQMIIALRKPPVA